MIYPTRYEKSNANLGRANQESSEGNQIWDRWFCQRASWAKTVARGKNTSRTADRCAFQRHHRTFFYPNGVLVPLKKKLIDGSVTEQCWAKTVARGKTTSRTGDLLLPRDTLRFTRYAALYEVRYAFQGHPRTFFYSNGVLLLLQKKTPSWSLRTMPSSACYITATLH